MNVLEQGHKPVVLERGPRHWLAGSSVKIASSQRSLTVPNACDQVGCHYRCDAFGLLAGVGWDRLGAIQFCPEHKLDDLATGADEHILVSDAGIAQRIRDLSAAWAMPGEHWSLAGSRRSWPLRTSVGVV